MASSTLKKLLLSNTAHEVRTPLNAIINYLEIALEGTLDQETRDSLTRSHSASKSLVYVINDLLDLTKTEEGQVLINEEKFDLLATVREVTDSFKAEADRKGLQYVLIEHSGIPQWVCGDQRCIRQAVSNIIANAIGNTSSGQVLVELWLAGVLDNMPTIEWIVEDSGAGMSEKQVDALFRDLEQVSSEESELFEDSEKSSEQLIKGKGDRILGLGLAVVARIVRNMNGQLRVKSYEGQGSRFTMQLPFSLPDNDGQATGVGGILSRSISLPPVSTDEITLVATCSPEGNKEDLRKRTEGRSRSSRSGESDKSNVDQITERISTSFNSQGEGLPPAESTVQARNSNMAGLNKPRGSVSAQPFGSVDIPGYKTIAGERALMRAVRIPEELYEHEVTDARSHVIHDTGVESANRKGDEGKPLDAER